MQRIESGTTGERKIRSGLFTLMCAVFAGYFYLDGWYRYPAQNREWAMQFLPQEAPRDQVVTSPRVTRRNLEALRARVFQPGQPVSRQELLERLGPPAYEAPDGDLYFIGPAMFFHADLQAGQLVPAGWKNPVVEGVKHTESDIRWNRWLAPILGVVVVISLIRLVRILRARAVLDDSGLTYGGKFVSWESMTGIDAGDYARKGWLDLRYTEGGQTRTLRLDNYEIREFRPIVAAICERKGFPSPLAVPEESD